MLLQPSHPPRKEGGSFLPLAGQDADSRVQSCAPGHVGRAGIGAQSRAPRARQKFTWAPVENAALAPPRSGPTQGQGRSPLAGGLCPHCPEHTHLAVTAPSPLPRALYSVPSAPAVSYVVEGNIQIHRKYKESSSHLKLTAVSADILGDLCLRRGTTWVSQEPDPPISWLSPCSPAQHFALF